MIHSEKFPFRQDGKEEARERKNDEKFPGEPFRELKFQRRDSMLHSFKFRERKRNHGTDHAEKTGGTFRTLHPDGQPGSEKPGVCCAGEEGTGSETGGTVSLSAEYGGTQSASSEEKFCGDSVVEFPDGGVSAESE